MASSKTAPKNDGADTTATTTGDAPAAENLADMKNTVTKTRLEGDDFDKALKEYQETGKPPAGVAVKLETRDGQTRQVFIKRS